MKAAPNEKIQEGQKGPGGQDPVNSGRSDQGQKSEPVNYGYENGIAKPDAQRQDGENPDEDGRNKEWQDRARVNLENTPPDTITNIERNFEEEESVEKPKKDTFY